MAIGEAAFPEIRPKPELLTLRVNGREYTLAAKPYAVLLDVLRDELGLTGTKRGCDMGTCGCCAVQIDGEVRFSCLELAHRASGKDLKTIEGLGDNGKLHPLQKSFQECGASQCGFCTPGFLMTADAFLKENPDPKRDELLEALGGNLCRCTGFIKIFEAVEKAATEMSV